jgi:PIN domain nuclease of toxin-antitoxin system
MENSNRLSRRAARIIGNPKDRILISAAVGWELAIKVSSGKMKPRSILDDLDQVLLQEEFSELPIKLEVVALDCFLLIMVILLIEF